jgi:hypothetical protein
MNMIGDGGVNRSMDESQKCVGISCIECEAHAIDGSNPGRRGDRRVEVLAFERSLFVQDEMGSAALPRMMARENVMGTRNEWSMTFAKNSMRFPAITVNMTEVISSFGLRSDNKNLSNCGRAALSGLFPSYRQR